METKKLVLEQHPLARQIIPSHTKEEIEGLLKSIGEIGQIEDGYLFEGKVLEGWARYQSCQKLGKDFKFKEFHENGIGPVEFIVSRLEGRHLTKAQRACVAVEAYDKRKAEVKKSREWNNQHTGKTTKKPNKSHEDIASQFGVNSTWIVVAAKLKKHNQGLFNDVKNGKMSIRQAQVLLGHVRKPGVSDVRYPVADTEELLQDIKIPSVFAYDSEIWAFDEEMRKRGWDLVIDRVRDSFEAKYIKHENVKLKISSPNFKHAIISAAREALGCS